jgi:predicted phage-related endonuclease
MITDKATQGTKEWREARGGIPTASAFDRIITTKGEPSKQRQKYMYALAAERIAGVTENGYESEAMKRGKEMEAEARAMYELMTGLTVEQVGVCYPNEEKPYGCSPDGLVGKDGCLEIKSPTSPVHVGYLLNGTLPVDYFQQVQGQLLVTGRKWCDFFSYYPALPPLLIRVKPDEKFLKALMIELEVFCKELDEIETKLRGM